jgi:hypothetical protein
VRRHIVNLRGKPVALTSEEVRTLSRELAGILESIDTREGGYCPIARDDENYFTVKDLLEFLAQTDYDNNMLKRRVATLFGRMLAFTQFRKLDFDARCIRDDCGRHITEKCAVDGKPHKQFNAGFKVSLDAMQHNAPIIYRGDLYRIGPAILEDYRLVLNHL